MKWSALALQVANGPLYQPLMTDEREGWNITVKKKPK
jgi:hypothetical protein